MRSFDLCNGWRQTLRSIHKGSSLCPNPFKGFILRCESFEGLKGVGDQTAVSWSALLRHHPMPTRRCRHHANNQRKGSWEPEVSISCTLQNPSFRRALWNGRFWALRFGTTLKYGGHDCFYSEMQYMPFGTHRTCDFSSERKDVWGGRVFKSVRGLLSAIVNSAGYHRDVRLHWNHFPSRCFSLLPFRSLTEILQTLWNQLLSFVLMSIADDSDRYTMTTLISVHVQT